ncbi:MULTISPECIES: DUF3509 domain-containing protein [Pseudomonas]|jgi:hypothetical protein|uniref:DUF3509 domain-containing protein n=1 Tax=Pseudomonas marincola TaxID=437900 RepID=A0A1I7BF55_9PSED|nr:MULTISPECIES: DUF3509 domain-containing protein [Pseudomonas]MAB98341.1 DUF3509 domain-containing protein [Pseudomonadaceae bacterium]NRH27015.1 DUF3509 domain-containing protein [Pseudomonas sp. MS19]OEO26114.1 hypothetical protein AX279_09650 [Pseudomonas sp. J237]CAE6914138.1 conserved protein of unknown function [Pseudomonas marincola]SFT85829.1 Protein of unknown function [Pseudomonas marincola]|tara:strand:- start:319 stop:606 length:288 start_codon:yes stop_codon:yes gene_type:complete
MDSTKREFVEQLFSPLKANFSLPRPDSSIVLSLIDDSETTVYSRVLGAAQLNDTQAFAQSLEEIRLELAVRSGNIPADLRKSLKEQDSVLSYHIA